MFEIILADILAAWLPKTTSVKLKTKQWLFQNNQKGNYLPKTKRQTQNKKQKICFRHVHNI